MIRVHPIIHATRRQLIENAGHGAEPAFRINVAFLRPVKVPHEPRRDTALETRSHAKHTASQLLNYLAPHTRIGYGVGKEAEIPQPPKWGVLGIVIKKVPMSVARWGQAGQNGRNCPGAEAQYGAERIAVGQQVGQELATLEQAPTKGIDQDEEADVPHPSLSSADWLK